MSLLKTVLATSVVLYRQPRMLSLSQACPALVGPSCGRDVGTVHIWDLVTCSIIAGT